MHSWSTCKTPLHLSLPPPHSELLPTRQGDAHHSITYEDEVDRRVFAHPAQSLSEKTSTIGSSTCPLHIHNQTSRTSLQESHQTFEGLHVLGVGLLHASRQFLRCELRHLPHQSSAHQDYSQPVCDTKISTCRGSASSSHRSPPSAPRGYSPNSLFRWIASCTSPMSTLGPSSCRLDQQMLSKLVSECSAKRPSSTQGEVVIPATPT